MQRPLSASGELTWTAATAQCCATGLDSDLELSIVDDLIDDLITIDSNYDGERFCQVSPQWCQSQSADNPATAWFSERKLEQDWSYYRLKTRYNKFGIEIVPARRTWATSSPEWRPETEYEGLRCGMLLTAFAEIEYWEAAASFNVKSFEYNRTGTLNYFGSACSAIFWPGYSCTRTPNPSGLGCFDTEPRTYPTIGSGAGLKWTMARSIFLPDYYSLPTGAFIFRDTDDVAPSNMICTTYNTRAPLKIETLGRFYCPASKSLVYQTQTCFVSGGAGGPSSFPINTVRTTSNIDYGWQINGAACGDVTSGLGTRILNFTSTGTGLPVANKTFWNRLGANWTLNLS